MFTVMQRLITRVKTRTYYCVASLRGQESSTIVSLDCEQNVNRRCTPLFFYAIQTISQTHSFS